MGITARRAFGPSKQLAAATLPTAGAASNPWGSDTNALTPPVERIVLQADFGNAPGTYIEYGGPGITYGNGLQLGPGDSAEVNAPNAATVWVIPSANGLKLRGQVQ